MRRPPGVPAPSHRAQTNRGCADRHAERRSWGRSRVRAVRGVSPTPSTQRGSSACALSGEVAARGAPVNTEARESHRSHRAGIRARSRSRKRIRTSRQARKYSEAALASITRTRSIDSADASEARSLSSSRRSAPSRTRIRRWPSSLSAISSRAIARSRPFVTASACARRIGCPS